MTKKALQSTRTLKVDKLRANKTYLEYFTLMYHILLQQSE